MALKSSQPTWARCSQTVIAKWTKALKKLKKSINTNEFPHPHSHICNLILQLSPNSPSVKELDFLTSIIPISAPLLALSPISIELINTCEETNQKSNILYITIWVPFSKRLQYCCTMHKNYSNKILIDELHPIDLKAFIPTYKVNFIHSEPNRRYWVHYLHM